VGRIFGMLTGGNRGANLGGLSAIFRDPFYAWEARTYWTWQRYLVSYLLLAGVWSGVLDLAMEGLAAAFPVGDAPEVAFAVLALLCRLPLVALAASATALSIAPERAAGRLEQLILTPVEPLRLLAARFAARLKGLALAWVLGAVPLLVGAARITDAAAWPGPWTGDPATRSVLLVVAAQVETAAAVLLAGAVGMYCSARFASAIWAQATALTVSVVALPGLLAVCGCSVGGVFAGVMSGGGPVDYWSVCAAAVSMATRATIAGILAWVIWRRAYLRLWAVFYLPQ